MAKQAQAKQAFSVNMILAKETKGALQYKEVNEQGQEVEFGSAKIGTLYLRKSGFASGFPKAIQVAVIVAG